MSTQDQTGFGRIGWTDLTVEDAETIRDFYSAVVGWSPEPVSMGEYSDFNMCSPGGGEAVAGICHARGQNADIPPQWIMYITVEDAERSARTCVERGGHVIVPVRREGKAAYCVIQDPAGAVVALYAPGA